MFRAVRRSSATFWLESRLDSASSGHRIPVSEAVPDLWANTVSSRASRDPLPQGGGACLFGVCFSALRARAYICFRFVCGLLTTSIGPASLFERVRRQDVTRHKSPLQGPQELHGSASRSWRLQRTSEGSSSAMTSEPRHPASCPAARRDVESDSCSPESTLLLQSTRVQLSAMQEVWCSCIKFWQESVGSVGRPCRCPTPSVHAGMPFPHYLLAIG